MRPSHAMQRLERSGESAKGISSPARGPEGRVCRGAPELNCPRPSPPGCNRGVPSTLRSRPATDDGWAGSLNLGHKAIRARLFNIMKYALCSLTLLLHMAMSGRAETDTHDRQTNAGWVKSGSNPVLGGKLGTCFDIAVLRDGDRYRMWFSWRPKKAIALVESTDGVHWSEPQIALGPNLQSDWEADVNRPVVVKRADGYHLWFTGQAQGRSQIGYATSMDGKTWIRASNQPVLAPDQPWEKTALMCPHVEWDETSRLFRMWYSGGEQYEPDAIGYATSLDGKAWTKRADNPIFRADPKNQWEQHKVTACQVIRQGDWHYMFYIGFRDVNHAQIGIARSRDGVTGWERHPSNPIISPGKNEWDHDACYKPFAIFDGSQWLLWYNGRHGSIEQIGLATHAGEGLGFPNRDSKAE